MATADTTGYINTTGVVNPMANTTTRADIDKIYMDTFGRPADDAGANYWASQYAAHPTIDLKANIAGAAMGQNTQDTVAAKDIAAGGVDTTKTWSNGASLDALTYDATNNTWGKLTTPVTPVTPAASSVSQYTAAQTTVDPTKTTGGLMNSLLAEDSEYLKRARALSMDKMNERGLGSSSLAQGAGTAAAIDAALGIAAPDAQIYSQTALTNTAAKNQANQFNSGALNTDALQTKQINSNQAIAQMNVDAQKALQLSTQQYTTLTNGSSNSLSIMTTLQSKLSAIQMDPNATADAKRSASTDAINIAKGAMTLIAHSTGDTTFNTVLDFINDQDSAITPVTPVTPVTPANTIQTNAWGEPIDKWGNPI